MKVTADWIKSEESGIYWLQLPITFPYKEMHEEAVNIRDMFVSYFGLYGPGTTLPDGKVIEQKDIVPMSQSDGIEGYRGWKGVCLHGYGPDKLGAAANYGHYGGDETAPYKWTEAADRCPIITDFLKSLNIYDRFYRVRLWLLEPGGYLKWHNDYAERHLANINFNLNHPAGSRMSMKGSGPLPFKAGRVFLLDLSNMHQAENNSSLDRYHLMVHGRFTPKFDNLILRGYNKQYPDSKI